MIRHLTLFAAALLVAAAAALAFPPSTSAENLHPRADSQDVRVRSPLG